ncbi:MAG: cell surface protein [Bacteroidota bacterium]|nr:cell surface protein [Bacteroidota bacterium]
MQSMYRTWLIGFLIPLSTFIADAQFSGTATKWPTPQGGIIAGNYPLGFNYTAPITINGYPVSNNSETWNLLDMNGDGKPDLVVTAEALGNNNTPTQFGAGASPHWNVYLNTGTQFSSTPITWSTPIGGIRQTGFYDIIGRIAGADSSDLWDLTDMDGDGKPDLLVTGTWKQGFGRQYSATSNPYWLVYLNTGSGFSSAAITWSTPTGGFIVNGTDHLGYNITEGNGGNNPGNGAPSDGSHHWALLDVNGDHKPDMVITAIVDTGVATQFNAGANPYWQVYLNTGTGFSATATNWKTPVGGAVNNYGVRWGYNQVGERISNYFAGSELWNISDIDGDGKPDLVVTALQSNVQGDAAEFNSTSTPYWKVYLNTGTGFSPNALAWRTPTGGIDLRDTLGYYYFGQEPGAQLSVYNEWTVDQGQWSLTDLNGDGKPDLVVTGKWIDASGVNYVAEFGIPSTPCWKIFLNSGTGFDTVGQLWFTPSGGELVSGRAAGYNYVNALAGADPSDLSTGEGWSLTDLDGDGFPELVVESNTRTGGNVEFSDSTGPYWKVFKNLLTGIAENKTTALWVVYPNPSNTGWHLKVNAELLNSTVEIFDVTGRRVFESVITDQQSLITLPGAATGIYTLRITSDSYSDVKILVKM